MAHLWMFVPSNVDGAVREAGGWSLRPLEHAATLGAARLQRASTPTGARWVVVGPPSVRVNGAALDAGIAVLRDRDELCVDGRRTYFSSETLATVVAFPGSDREVCCARCRTPIVPGAPALACPQCGLWYHQCDDLACWTHDPRCVADDQATALDAGFRFTPEDL